MSQKIFDALRDLAPYVQFNKREKHPWRRVSFSKASHIAISYKLCDALHDFESFVQFKKREKHPWMSVTCSMQASANITLLHECFSSFSNGTIGTESRKGSHIMKVCPWSS